MSKSYFVQFQAASLRFYSYSRIIHPCQFLRKSITCCNIRLNFFIWQPFRFPFCDCVWKTSKRYKRFVNWLKYWQFFWSTTTKVTLTDKKTWVKWLFFSFYLALFLVHFECSVLKIHFIWSNIFIVLNFVFN